MDLALDLGIVNLLDFGHGVAAERREVRRGGIVLDLGRTLCARDRAGDRREHQDPSEGQLSQRRSSGFQTALVIDAGKSFASIERLTFAVESPMIVLGE